MSIHAEFYNVSIFIFDNTQCKQLNISMFICHLNCGQSMIMESHCLLVRNSNFNKQGVYFAMQTRIKQFNLIKFHKKYFNFHLNIKLLRCHFTFINITFDFILNCRINCL